MNKKIATTAAAFVAAAGIALGVTSMASADPSDTPTPVASATVQVGAGAPVTGPELAAVDNAINSKAHIVNISSVTRNDDGSYDVKGDLAGTPVHYTVSADLETITDQNPPAWDESTLPKVTGDELAKVNEALKANGHSVELTSVTKNEDGSYNVQGTENGAAVELLMSSEMDSVVEV